MKQITSETHTHTHMYSYIRAVALALAHVYSVARARAHLLRRNENNHVNTNRLVLFMRQYCHVICMRLLLLLLSLLSYGSQCITFYFNGAMANYTYERKKKLRFLFRRKELHRENSMQRWFTIGPIDPPIDRWLLIANKIYLFIGGQDDPFHFYLYFIFFF